MKQYTPQRSFSKLNTACLVLFLFISLMVSCQSESSSDDTPIIKPDPVEEPDKTFQLAILPDTQYYTAEKHGGTMEMFENQINWILDNVEENNIAYVVHLGDLVDHGEQAMEEWEKASEVMYKLETTSTKFPDGIPYGIAVGNHDQEPLGNPEPGGTDKGYNYYFGKDRFKDRAYYGDAYSGSGNTPNNNDNHYDLFSANGDDFIVMYIEYNEPGHEDYNLAIEQEVLAWAGGILANYSNRKAIIVSHSILARHEDSNSITRPDEGDNSLVGDFTKQGQRLYDYFKNSPNVFMMLSGHRSGEGYRKDTHNGSTIKTFLSDYQSRENQAGERHGGGGLMRTMEFNQTKNTITVKTFSPTGSTISYERDSDSNFTVPLFE